LNLLQQFELFNVRNDRKKKRKEKGKNRRHGQVEVERCGRSRGTKDMATTYALDFGSQFFWILDVTWITYIFLDGESLQIKKTPICDLNIKY